MSSTESLEFYFTLRGSLTRTRPTCLRGHDRIMTQKEWVAFAQEINQATRLYAGLVLTSILGVVVFTAQFCYFGSQMASFDNEDFNSTGWVAGMIVVAVGTVSLVCFNYCVQFARSEENLRRICEEHSKRTIVLEYTKETKITEQYWQRRDDDDDDDRWRRNRYYWGPRYELKTSMTTFYYIDVTVHPDRVDDVEHNTSPPESDPSFASSTTAKPPTRTPPPPTTKTPPAYSRTKVSATSDFDIIEDWQLYFNVERTNAQSMSVKELKKALQQMHISTDKFLMKKELEAAFAIAMAGPKPQEATHQQQQATSSSSTALAPPTYAKLEVPPLSPTPAYAPSAYAKSEIPPPPPPPAYAPSAPTEPPIVTATVVMKEEQEQEERSVADRLALLDSLKSSLTAEEYQRKRQEILDSI